MTLVNAERWSRVAQELVTALRGGRSRAQLSRKLGYRTNAVSDWEAGRRFPTASEFLAAAELLRCDVDGAFARFHAATASALRDEEGFTLDRWLSLLRGRTPLQLVAERAGLSRFAVSRFLTGQTRPRLPQFLQLVEAITDRTSDLADALVGIDNVPSLRTQHQRRSAAKNLAFEYPASEGLLRVMETRSYQSLAKHRRGALASALAIEPELEQRILDALENAGVLRAVDGRYSAQSTLTVDTHAEPAARNKLKAYWTRVALERLAAPREEDWLGYNLMSLAEADLERVREIMRAAYREIRAVAAASVPVERAALLNLQLVTFPPVPPA
jgi:transcriptional regulator with XRE-family HTH domain